MKVLVALDGSDCSMTALDFVTSRPWKRDDEFMVLTVVEPIRLDVGVGHVPPPTVTIDHQTYKDSVATSKAGEEKIRKALPDNQAQSRVEEGFVADTICGFAKEWQSDLIILGSHGRKGIKHFLLGSVAEEVLKQAGCSVEIVKNVEVPTERDKPAQKEKANLKIS